MVTANSRQFLGQILTLKIDRPLGSRHPQWGFRYPLNYGYVPDEFAPDGEELDAYVLGISEPLATFTGQCIAIIHRLDDDDDKLVVVSEGQSFSDAEILALTAFQERFFQVEVWRQERP